MELFFIFMILLLKLCELLELRKKMAESKKKLLQFSL